MTRTNKVDRHAIHAKYNGHCAYCGKPIALKEMQVDHIHARLRGGDDDSSNFNPSCRRCNAWKATYTTEEFRHEIKMQVQRLRQTKAGFRLAEDFGQLVTHDTDVRFYFEEAATNDTIK